MLPSNQTGLATVSSIMLSQKTIRGNFEAKIFKTRRAKQKNKTKARGELFASSFRNFDSRETHADLTNQLLANRVTRKCGLCSQGKLPSADLQVTCAPVSCSLAPQNPSQLHNNSSLINKHPAVDL